MSSIITSMLAKIFPKQECRSLMLGLDSSGRTTMLYKLKLGEVVTTIPTIGFNVESYCHKSQYITLWDVGGCDKIRPLWRHYYQNTQCCMFFFDSSDRERFPEALQEFRRLLEEEVLRDCLFLVWANKQDLPNAMRAEEVKAAVADAMAEANCAARKWECFGSSSVSGDGLEEGLDWLISALGEKPSTDRRDPPPDGDGGGGAAGRKGIQDMTEEEKLEATLLEWLEREDEGDDEFLQKLHDYTLDSWDHYTHLRIAWLLLTRHGRREGMKRIFEGIREFIANSARTVRSRGTTFHESMTFFWVHMVDYARASTANPQGDFKTFLLVNPQLCNGGMFLHFYSRKLMLQTSDARTQVLLPDVRPLPSLLSNVDAAATSTAPAEDFVSPSKPLTDDEWVHKFEQRLLPSWGHEARLRLIWIRLKRLPRREAVKGLFSDLEAFERQGHHVTLVYFWVSMVTLCMAKAADAETFNSFVQRTSSQCLRNPDLIDKHYSQRLLASADAKAAFAAPDLKPIPSVVPGA
eukprot:CAMPEP_0181294310 /NCGR_PEP_ID=MMETSP1101-20121128/3528_1 /TAXON_ID=46948 /ORGANISM="Rhodomonas abbreviata, Strain Caron Lab Isolate" /LENGTH=520 /DNA_ID=CAMNT_0023398951 /DNA_START=105 /DNA_END=1667 /DNA_ORIENTATION=+